MMSIGTSRSTRSVPADGGDNQRGRREARGCRRRYASRSAPHDGQPAAYGCTLSRHTGHRLASATERTLMWYGQRDNALTAVRAAAERDESPCVDARLTPRTGRGKYLLEVQLPR